ncbi:MAG: transglutaminase domain-containing protein [Flavobacteriales bacterium]|nr:transglutaminase domain-containing protein [Flavobacteriales bacterium]
MFISILILIFLGGSYYLNKHQSSFSGAHGTLIRDSELPVPPRISYNVSSQRKAFIKDFFTNCNLSGEKRKLLEACDFSNKDVRDFAIRIAGNSPGTYNLGQICDLFDQCFANWKYVNDPKGEDYIAAASETLINNYTGDCDDFAVLVCSSILAVGGEARISYAYKGKKGHAFTEVNLGTTPQEIVTEYLSTRYNLKVVQGKKDKAGNWWINLDWFSGFPGGPYFNYTKGQRFYIIQNYCENL